MKIHLDLDAFFISAERIRKPSLRNIPAAVGGRGDPFIFNSFNKNIDTTHANSGAFVPSIMYDAKNSFEEYFIEGKKIRGIIITASYEARKYGIKTGMTIREALQVYPSLQVVPPNHLYYHELSHKLHLFLKKELPAVEQFSIDEFFADLSGWVNESEIEPFLHSLQQKILKTFHLPISIGAAKSKWTAKLATSFAKPHGIKVVRDVEQFISPIPIEQFPGIGRGYCKRLRNYGIKTLGETKEIKELFYSWKKPGITLYKRIWGIDNEPIEHKSPRKSVGISRTIDPLIDRQELQRRIVILARHLAFSVARLRLEPKFYLLSLKYENGSKAKAHTLSHKIFSEQLLKNIALELLTMCDILSVEPIIRISLHCSRFYDQKLYDIFTYEGDKKLYNLFNSTNLIRKKFGIDKIMWGIEMQGGKAAMENS
ncbi:DNA polymerase IV [Nitratiruptor sp. YY08-26]|uniref:DNA polymerase Y family protein n=1 Tax=unclassified Nitratiruptor TaxID=2624044 RepID=UPI0019157248|nr:MULTISPECIES: DNA polymerase IV [unclassified Nitratiruptor]BCD61472.1 DNA polymerase IV [Nitratiruptor sp. YY08-13]BCD65406.1 DNA polymerase IV [Nitratiruptor sp. YY08-26]